MLCQLEDVYPDSFTVGTSSDGLSINVSVKDISMLKQHRPVEFFILNKSLGGPA